jgi:hypothetical protein
LKKTYSNSIKKKRVSSGLPPGESLISTISQLALDIGLNICPESASAGAPMVRLHALAKDLSMLLRHRDLLRGRSDPAPERLHEVDLLID